MRGPRPWRIGATACALAIVVLGVVPTRAALQATVPEQESATTTVGHFVAYLVFAFALAMALGGPRPIWRDLLLAGALAVALGVLVELVQGPLPYRDLQLEDAVVDALGAALGLVAVSVVARARGPRPRSRHG
jgi:VanZ family protein